MWKEHGIFFEELQNCGIVITSALSILFRWMTQHQQQIMQVEKMSLNAQEVCLQAHIRKRSEYPHHRRSVAGDSSFTIPLIQQFFPCPILKGTLQAASKAHHKAALGFTAHIP
jgi:hypothetical protein